MNKSTLNGRDTHIDDELHDTADNEEAPKSPPATSTPADAEVPSTASAARRRPGWWRFAIIALFIVLIAGGLYGYSRYSHTADELAALRQSDADRAAVAQAAKDYAIKSLTYSFEDPGAFFQAVEDGVSAPLKDKYVNATELLTGIMLQAQVTSTGEVLATEVTTNPDNTYQAVVSASQTTRNLQNPQPQMSVILLQITIAKVGDGWQVTDIGPKSGRPPAGEPGPTGPAAGPAPAPGTAAPAPAPPR